MANNKYKLNVPINKLNDSTTINITTYFTKQFYIRMWIFTRLLKLAAWVLGCGIEINTKDTEDTE